VCGATEVEKLLEHAVLRSTLVSRAPLFWGCRGPLRQSWHICCQPAPAGRLLRIPCRWPHALM